MARIVLGVSGSIAAYKAIELVHALQQCGHVVKVILTANAECFVSKTSFAAFGVEVYAEENNLTSDGAMRHIDLAKWPELIVLVPLSANTLSKLACGLGDNLLLATVLATPSPVYLVPAMNMYMWNNVIIQDNVRKLHTYGYIFWGPDCGIQACGDNGIGRMLAVEEILAKITHALLAVAKSFSGLRVVVTAGATQEALDPARYLSNYSSGKMGLALAYALSSCGAEVCLISGYLRYSHPHGLNKVVTVRNTKEMLEASCVAAENADIYIACAAVADYTIEHYQSHKLKKQASDSLHLHLIKTPDIVSRIKQLYPNLFVVGFAAETHNIIEYAQAKLNSKNLDMIVANDVSSGKVFASAENEVSVLDRESNITLIPKADKSIIAHKILHVILSRYHSLGHKQ